jgi:hypothetical protein
MEIEKTDCGPKTPNGIYPPFAAVGQGKGLGDPRFPMQLEELGVKPTAVNVELCPAQILELEAVTVGGVVTVITAVDVLDCPFAVAVTV